MRCQRPAKGTIQVSLGRQIVGGGAGSGEGEGKQRRENRTSERRLNDESLERREEGRSEASSTGLLATLSPPQWLPITGDGHGALGELMRDGPPTYRHTAQTSETSSNVPARYQREYNCTSR
jgi:hypothetical protein